MKCLDGHTGSIPELSTDDKIYNSSPTFSPDGKLVALHRKVHLFDIDIPGGITFKESETLTGGDRVTIVETGEFVKVFKRTETMADVLWMVRQTLERLRWAFAMMLGSLSWLCMRLVKVRSLPSIANPYAIPL